MNTIHDDHAILLQLFTVFPLELDDNDDVQAVVLMLIILSACFPGLCVWLLMVMTMNNDHFAFALAGRCVALFWQISSLQSHEVSPMASSLGG